MTGVQTCALPISKVSQLIISPIDKHSKKPDIVREKIVELMGDLPRIELFARQTTPGWEVFGNEVKSSITLSEKEENYAVCNNSKGFIPHKE